MEVRGRNGKWFGTGSWGAIGKIGIVVVLEFGPWIGKCRDHRGVRGEDSDGSGGRSVNWKEGAVGRELAADFFFLNVEEASNVFDHLLVGKGHF